MTTYTFSTQNQLEDNALQDKVAQINKGQPVDTQYTPQTFLQSLVADYLTQFVASYKEGLKSNLDKLSDSEKAQIPLPIRTKLGI